MNDQNVSPFNLIMVNGADRSWLRRGVRVWSDHRTGSIPPRLGPSRLLAVMVRFLCVEACGQVMSMIKRLYQTLATSGLLLWGGGIQFMGGHATGEAAL
jgi:hypothetical protein